MPEPKIFKVSCEYYIKANTREEATQFIVDEIADGFDFYEAHLMLDETTLLLEEEIFADLTQKDGNPYLK